MCNISQIPVCIKTNRSITLQHTEMIGYRNEIAEMIINFIAEHPNASKIRRHHFLVKYSAKQQTLLSSCGTNNLPKIHCFLSQNNVNFPIWLPYCSTLLSVLILLHNTWDKDGVFYLPGFISIPLSKISQLEDQVYKSEHNLYLTIIDIMSETNKQIANKYCYESAATFLLNFVELCFSTIGNSMCAIAL